MGSWSATVMGGDGPWDAQGDILEFIGFDAQDGARDHVDHPAETKALLEQKTPAQWAAFFELGDSGSYTADKKRVAVVMILACGAVLPESLALAAIATCQAERQDGYSGWSDPDERRAHLEHFIALIGAYDGTPTEVPEEGLFEKITEHLDATPPPVRGPRLH